MRSNLGEHIVGLTSSGEIFTLPTPRAQMPPRNADLTSVGTKRKINCLKTVPRLVICGDSEGNLHGYSWDSLLNPTTVSPILTVGAAKTSVNDMLVLEDNNRLLLACGDGSVSIIELESPHKVCTRLWRPSKSN